MRVTILCLLLGFFAGQLAAQDLDTRLDRVTVKLALINGVASGALVRAKGRVMVLTNEHVCRDSPRMLVESTWQYPQIGVVQLMDPVLDLCLVAVTSFKDYLTLGAPPRINDHLVSKGYPHGTGPYLSEGNYLRDEAVALWAPRDACAEYEEKVYQGKQLLCGMTYFRYVVTIPIMGGQSGSPVIDKHGQLVALVAGVDTLVGTGYLVPVEHIKQFIKRYEETK